MSHSSGRTPRASAPGSPAATSEPAGVAIPAPGRRESCGNVVPGAPAGIACERRRIGGPGLLVELVRLVRIEDGGAAEQARHAAGERQDAAGERLRKADDAH